MTKTGRMKGEGAGFLASLAFTALASVRDVYFGGVFQSTSPLGIAVVAFTLCSLCFLPIALVRSPESFRVFRQRWRELFWINVTTGLAWISFFHALRTIEPLLVQILFAGVGPLTVMWVDRFAGITPLAPLSPAERPIYLGVSTVLSRRLNDGGAAPTALVSVRFIGAIVLAASLAQCLSQIPAGDKPPPYIGFVTTLFSGGEGVVVLGAILALIVFPIYVSQVGVSLASPLTVRAAMALGPVFIFLLQLVEGRLSPSPYSLATGVVYAIFAVSAAVARRRQRVVSVAILRQTLSACESSRT